MLHIHLGDGDRLFGVPCDAAVHVGGKTFRLRSGDKLNTVVDNWRKTIDLIVVHNGKCFADCGCSRTVMAAYVDLWRPNCKATLAAYHGSWKHGNGWAHCRGYPVHTCDDLKPNEFWWPEWYHRNSDTWVDPDSYSISSNGCGWLSLEQHIKLFPDVHEEAGHLYGDLLRLQIEAIASTLGVPRDVFLGKDEVVPDHMITKG